jgi:tRNA(Ile)-lysidine synthase
MSGAPRFAANEVSLILANSHQVPRVRELSIPCEDSSDVLTQLQSELLRLNSHRHDLLLAISGGVDSMVLLHAVAQLRDQLNGTVSAAHVNHGLRGQESDSDEQLVQDVCGQMQIPLMIRKLAEGEVLKNSNGSLEESARQARYQYLTQVARQRNNACVVTAHHQQDQVETVLFHLLRGTGLRGLRGMPEERELSFGVRLIRPFLTMSRQQILEYATNHQIAFREDSSNTSMDFNRNRIRHLLRIQMQLGGGELEHCLSQLAEQAARTTLAVDSVADLLLKQTAVEFSEKQVILDRSRLVAWDEPFVRQALVVLWTRCNWPRQQMSAMQWHRLSQQVFAGQPRQWAFPGGIRATVRRQHFHLFRHVQETVDK